MTAVAFRNRIVFDSDLAIADIDVGSVATDVYASPDHGKFRLGQMASLKYLTGALRGRLTLSASGTVSLTIRLTDGTTDFGSVSVSIAAGTEATFVLDDIDLTAASGSAMLYVAADVVTADAGKTAKLESFLDMTFPLIVTGCD